MLDAKASDLHLANGQPPHMRVSGLLHRMEFDYPTMDRMQMESVVSRILKSESGISRLYELEEIDLTHEWQGRRFRVNLGLSQGNIFAVFRHLKSNIPSPSTLGIPDELVSRVRKGDAGVVFVVGTTGSGKSTTLSATLGHVLLEHPYRVITIEDPVEYLIPCGRGMVTQREVGRDTLSFARALRAAMREDPDIILVGEVRDMETAQNCLAAAETGHLVLATLHTGQAYTVPNRFVGMFPLAEQNLVRQRLAESVSCVMAQRLEPNRKGGVSINTELLDATPEVREQILSGDTMTLKVWMAEGRCGWLFSESECKIGG
jgi:twitching motility protein PilT